MMSPSQRCTEEENERQSLERPIKKCKDKGNGIASGKRPVPEKAISIVDHDGKIPLGSRHPSSALIPSI
ncbi:hypothetical protein KY284_012514 [Solanum tuberosum]|nr:hypothetical protein KY284_012514 [Solanum tuberosum]